MVSNSLRIDLDELLGILKRLHRDCCKDPDYRKWRPQLPADWPF